MFSQCAAVCVSERYTRVVNGESLPIAPRLRLYWDFDCGRIQCLVHRECHKIGYTILPLPFTFLSLTLSPPPPLLLRPLHGGGGGEQADQDGLHASPAPGAGEGVPVQQVHQQAAACRAGPHPQPHRETHQDLVPEPTDEVEEGGGQEESEGDRPRAGLVHYVRRLEG